MMVPTNFRQADLFACAGGAGANARALARRTDPQESRAAALDIAPRVNQVQRDVLAMVRKHPGCTVSELASYFGARDPRRIGRRLPELERKGLVVRELGQPCTVTGESAARWMLLDAERKTPGEKR